MSWDVSIFIANLGTSTVSLVRPTSTADIPQQRGSVLRLAGNMQHLCCIIVGRFTARHRRDRSITGGYCQRLRKGAEIRVGDTLSLSIHSRRRTFLVDFFRVILRRQVYLVVQEATAYIRCHCRVAVTYILSRCVLVSLARDEPRYRSLTPRF